MARTRSHSQTAGGAWRPLTTTLAVIVALELAQRAGFLPIYIPAPSQVADEALRNPHSVSDNVLQTLWRASAGYGIAGTIALAAGAVAVSLRALHGPIYSLGVTLHSIPIIAMAPLLAVWMGNGSQLQIVIAALSSQFAMLVGAMQGLSAADARQRELFHVLAAGRAQVLRHLLIPSALPYLFAGFKIAAPTAVLGAITAEWAGADRGVGAMMLYALFAYDVRKVWLAVLMACLLAAAGYALWALIERLVIRWSPQAEIAD